MAKFVTLPQHWNRSPITVNVDRVCFIEHSNYIALAGSRIKLSNDLEIEINLSVEEVIALFNSKE